MVPSDLEQFPAAALVSETARSTCRCSWDTLRHQRSPEGSFVDIDGAAGSRGGRLRIGSDRQSTAVLVEDASFWLDDFGTISIKN